MLKCVKEEVERYIRLYKMSCAWYNFPDGNDIPAFIEGNYSEDFMRTFKDCDFIKWGDVITDNTLSMEFIEEFLNKFTWGQICMYQELTEEFMRKHQDNIEWALVIDFQSYSKDFQKEYKKELEEGLEHSGCLSYGDV